MSFITKFFKWLASLFGGKKSTTPTQNTGGSTQVPPTPAPSPAPVDPTKPKADPKAHDLSGLPDGVSDIDELGRVRIPAVEALGRGFENCWWYTSWPLEAGRVYEDVSEWQLRFAVGCDEHGVLGPCPGRGYEDGVLGDEMTVYTWRVPVKYVDGIDRYGRHIVFQASTTDYVENGVIHQARQLGEPIYITDKLTRATRAKDVAELAAFLKAHPGIKPIPDTPAPWPIATP